MIIFRTDASTKTGFGHLKRSDYLASLLKSNHEILFCINSKNDKTVNRYLQEKKWPFCSLKQLIKENKFPTVSIVFDLRYFADEDLQLIQRAKASNWATLQITDLGLSQQEVDYTVDSSVEPLHPYNPGKQVFSGPAYAILHHRFRHFHKITRKYRQTIKNIFICLGGAIEYRPLRNVIDLLSRQGLEVKIAPGFYLKKSAQKILKRIYPRIRFVGKTDNLARSLFEADIAVITTGVTAFEAAACGTPALYFYHHDEQKFIAQSFEKNGAGLVISNIDDLLHVNPVEKMKELTLEKRIDMGNKGKQLVDGRGVYRVIDIFKQYKII